MGVNILCLVLMFSLGYVFASESKCDKLERDIFILTELTETQRAFDENRIARLEYIVELQQKSISKLEKNVEALTTSKSKRLVFDKLDFEGIAFSANFDHNLDSADNQLPIAFNIPTFNDGSHYNVTTGVFVWPVNGVYLFIYFVGNRNARERDAELVVNGVKQNEVVAEGVQNRHDTQGGNSAIVRLTTGDKVWVGSTYGSHVEDQWRYSTFNGALLYPTQK